MSRHPIDKFDAREWQTLGEHLRGVEAAIEALTANRGDTQAGDDWQTVATSLAWSHDFGKLTPWFQGYLHTDDRSQAPTPQHTYHGEVSALITIPVLNAAGCSRETVAAGFLAVAKHHSVLPDLQSQLKEYNRSEKTQTFQRLDDQLKAIDTNAPDGADQLISTASDGALNWSDISSVDAASYRATIDDLVSVTDHDWFYQYVLSLWSTLVTADKSDASQLTTSNTVTELATTERPDCWKLTQRVDRLASTELPNGQEARWYRRHPDATLPDASASISQRVAAIQTAANARATKAIKKQSDNNVFEITLPTGFGKTYTGLRAALNRADIRNSRVIYTLPYTSIIDQVDNEVRSIFELEPHTKPYTKHHHLADTRTAENELDVGGYGTGRETIHAESWRSGLVLTTFIQLFESLTGPRNVQSMKLPALQDSVILLDEPQTAPHEWWALIGRLVEYCVETYDTTVILMTATQPRILEQLDDVPNPKPLIELTDACSAVLDSAPRVTFDIHDSLDGHIEGNGDPLPLSVAGNEIVEATANGSNTLSIVNTVECAVSMTEEILGENRLALGSQILSYHQNRDTDIVNGEDYISYLASKAGECELLTATVTTRLRPVDRQLLLDAIDHIIDPDTTTPFDNVPTITISTQLIEAGVDISFDRLYRDFAPLPAIVQAAGRCNRSFDGPTRPVTMWRLDSPPDSDYTPSSLIYGEQSLLRPTQTVLKRLQDDHSNSLPEAAVIDAGIDTYYEILHAQRQTGRGTDELVAAFDSGNGEKLRTASLISEEYNTIDVLVLVTETERRQYDAYRQAKDGDDEGDWKDASELFQELQSCLVSIPVSEDSPDDELRIQRSTPEGGDYTILTGQGIDSDNLAFDTEL
jgi:CRISPR-associated endonuclease Cas3-HD